MWTASRRSRWAGWSPGLPAFHACTPAGMIELMKRYGLPIAGKHAVVVGPQRDLRQAAGPAAFAGKRDRDDLPFADA